MHGSIDQVVARTLDRKDRRNTNVGSIPRCGKGCFFPSQLSGQSALLRRSYSRMDQDLLCLLPESTLSADQLSYGLRIIARLNMILCLLPRVNFQCKSTPYGVPAVAWIKICANISDPRLYQPCRSLDRGKILHSVWVALLLRQL